MSDYNRMCRPIEWGLDRVDNTSDDEKFQPFYVSGWQSVSGGNSFSVGNSSLVFDEENPPKILVLYKFNLSDKQVIPVYNSNGNPTPDLIGVSCRYSVGNENVPQGIIDFRCGTNIVEYYTGTMWQTRNSGWIRVYLYR